jgi:hypothetical protein
VWAETGGPAITATPELQGFGSRMVLLNLGGPLGGSIDYDLQPTGLVATLTIKLSAMPL